MEKEVKMSFNNQGSGKKKKTVQVKIHRVYKIDYE